MLSTLSNFIVFGVLLLRPSPASPSISLGSCSLSCNEENSTHMTSPSARLMAGPPGKLGPKGSRGERGMPGPRGERGRHGESCDCSVMEEASTKLDRLIENRFNDCRDVKRLIPTDGISVIFPFAHESVGIHVYCDQTTDNGGWIVIQRRDGGTENFYRGWNYYVTGFGIKESAFWMGLEIIHKLVRNGTWELRVDLVDHDENRAFAKYRSFSIAGASDNYRLSVSGYQGTAGDGLAYHNGMQFTTKDRDNDRSQLGKCALSHHGAWWYNHCHQSNLNGRYGGSVPKADGVTWLPWHNRHVSLKRAEMKIRRVE